MNALTYSFDELLRRCSVAANPDQLTNARRDVEDNLDSLDNERRIRLYSVLKNKATEARLDWSKTHKRYVKAEIKKGGMNSIERFQFRQWVAQETGLHYCDTQRLFSGIEINGKDLSFYINQFNNLQK